MEQQDHRKHHHPRRKDEINDLSNAMFGKLPPQAIDIEQVVLGAVMTNKDAIHEIISILTPDSFYTDQHKHIFDAMQQLHHHNRKIDILTVSEQLKKMGRLEDVDGQMYLAELTNRVASTAHIVDHAHIIAQKELLRDYITIGSRVVQMAYEDGTDPFELGEIIEGQLMDAIAKHTGEEVQSMQQITKECIEEIELAYMQEESITGIPSGFASLDRVTGGWQNSDLILVGARPSMGKTGFAVQCARNAAHVWDTPVGIFSLEMSARQLGNRILGSEACVSSHKSRTGTITEGEFKRILNAGGQVSEMPIYIDDTAGIDILTLKSKARKMHREFGCRAFYIDYIQLVTVRYHTKDPVGEISRQLKSLAKELDVPVIALSQLSRAVETRGGDKRPQLSDLRESGGLEQDADVVIFLFRADYYEKEPRDTYGNDLRNLTELLIRKHRNGPLAEILVKFMKDVLRFYDYEPYRKEIVEFYAMKDKTGATIAKDLKWENRPDPEWLENKSEKKEGPEPNNRIEPQSKDDDGEDLPF